MARTPTASTTIPSLQSDDQIVAVAEGLCRVVGTDGAAEQLRRIYGERRAVRALAALAPAAAPGAVPPVPCTAPVLRRDLHRRPMPAPTGSRARTTARSIRWL
jgi:hypothetical protein